jgi:hypothetical protein
MSGFGKSIWRWSVVDRMQVPGDLEPGDYLLSLRWDCEQSDQVFQNCADIEIVINGSKVGQPPIEMDPSMKLTTYYAEGATKCHDDLYEDECQGKDTGKYNGNDIGAKCLKFDEKSCSSDASCELMTKEGKTYCWVVSLSNGRQAMAVHVIVAIFGFVTTTLL